MGVIRWLDRIDPARFKKAVDAIAYTTVAGLPDVTSLYERLDAPPDQEVLDQSTEALDESDDLLMALAFNCLLERYATVQEWDLDKALSRGLLSFIEALPDLKSLSDMADFKGADVDVPDQARAVDSGLFVVWSPEALQPAASALARYEDLNSLRQAVRIRSYSLLERLLRKPKRHLRNVSSRVSEEYYSTHWRSLREAVLETARTRHYLGMGMST